jgi:hypothetical protein
LGLSELKQIHDNLKEETPVKKNVQRLIAKLESPTPNEYELASALVAIAEIFLVEKPENNQELAEAYLKFSKQFFNRALAEDLFKRSRENIKASLDENKQKDFDLKLFSYEGMMYCLEYYLALYKAIVDAPSDEVRRRFIEEPEVNLGFGLNPALWADFNNDAVLEKFIARILNDDLRLKITKAYYRAKKYLMNIGLVCDKQGVCRASYQQTTLQSVIESFKQFLLVTLEVFQEVGIDRLKSYGFKPYGDKPLINDIIKQISQ